MVSDLQEEPQDHGQAVAATAAAVAAGQVPVASGHCLMKLVAAAAVASQPGPESDRESGTQDTFGVDSGGWDTHATCVQGLQILLSIRREQEQDRCVLLRFHDCQPVLAVDRGQA